MNRDVSVVELRQYTLHPGQRDTLVALFEREFIESQEALGIALTGPFRDADRPDRFVWLRSFPDMAQRKAALTAFYGSAVWKTHREAANATMIDSDNVLLLKPAWTGSGFAGGGARASRETTAVPPGFAVASICYFAAPVPEAFVSAFRGTMLPRIKQADARCLGAFVTEPSVNDFPGLPVREGENVFVWLTLFADERATREIALPSELEHALAKPVELVRLRPTPRSNVRW